MSGQTVYGSHRCCKRNAFTGVNEMAEWAKLGVLSSIPTAHMVEGEN